MTSVPTFRPVTDSVRAAMRDYLQRGGRGSLIALARASKVSYNGLLRFLHEDGAGISTHSLDRLAVPLGLKVITPDVAVVQNIEVPPATAPSTAS